MNFKFTVSFLSLLLIMALSINLSADTMEQDSQTIYNILSTSSKHLYRANNIDKIEDKLADLRAAQDLLNTIKDDALSSQLNIAKYVIWDARKTIKLYQLLMERQKTIDKDRLKEIKERIEKDIDKALDDIDHYYQQRG